MSAVADLQSQRIIVFGCIGGDVIGRRRQDLDFGAPKSEAARRNERHDFYAIRFILEPSDGRADDTAAATR